MANVVLALIKAKPLQQQNDGCPERRLERAGLGAPHRRQRDAAPQSRLNVRLDLTNHQPPTPALPGCSKKGSNSAASPCRRHSLPLHLLGKRFTLTALQRTCEAVLGRPLDKSVFRWRLKTCDDLVALFDEFAVGSHRPAQFYGTQRGLFF